MNTIINNRNYNFTKTFIEDNITAISSDQTKNMLISLYHALTPENAGKIYEVVAKLINEEYIQAKWKLSCEVWKYSGLAFAVSGVVDLATHYGLKHYPDNKNIREVQNISRIGLTLSAVAFFLAGWY